MFSFINRINREKRRTELNISPLNNKMGSVRTLNNKMGNEVRTTNMSKQNLRGYNNKYTGYMDASQLTRIRASSSVSKVNQGKLNEATSFNQPLNNWNVSNI
jgi:hypothetical protein